MASGEGGLYAIKHLRSGGYLPQGNGNRRHGFTHDEPVTPDVRPPRLFTTKVAASNALTWWLRGKARTHDPLAEVELRPLDYVNGVEIEPVPGRVSHEMAIVEVQIVSKGRVDELNGSTRRWRER